MSDTILFIIYILLIVIFNIVSYLLGKNFKNKHIDGIIIIDEVDEEGHAGMNLQFGIEYDELMKRKTMTFKVENHMTEAKNSQSL